MGPSGLTYHPGTGLWGRHQRTFFLCDFHGDAQHSGVLALQLRPDGAGFSVNPPEKFFWHVLATDVAFAADGSLYVSDWVQGWEKTGKGRIYRVADASGADDPLSRETQRLLAEGMAGRSASCRRGLLSHADQRVRSLAQYSLADEGVEHMYDLAAMAQGNAPLLARIHAIWALGQIHRLHGNALQSVVALLRDPEPEIRSQAARVFGDCNLGSAREALVAALADGSARVRALAAIALGRLGPGRGLRELVSMLNENADRDPFLRHAAVMGLTGVATAEELIAQKDHASVAVRRGVILALRRRGDPQVAAFLDDADSSCKLEAARAIYDVPIEGAMEALARQCEAMSFDDFYFGTRAPGGGGTRRRI